MNCIEAFGKNCPWCGDKEDLHLITCVGDEAYAVSCQGCGSSGPVAGTEAEAVLKWNDRQYND